MSRLRILFYGTSSFAVPALEHLLHAEDMEIVAVVTQPDKPAGRHGELQMSPIKDAAHRHGCPIKQYASVKDPHVYDELAAYKPDIAVVVSFGQIIPQRLLDLPRYGSINIHGSLLPRYRGSSPIHAAILAGDTQTGVTIMKMDAKMDHGPILACISESIFADDTVGRLHDRLAEIGGKEIAGVLREYISGQRSPVPQNDDEATYVQLLTREDGAIHWTNSAAFIERMLRAYDPWPGTFGFFEKSRLKVLAGYVLPLPQEQASATPGSCFVSDGLPCVVCGEQTALCMTRLQPEGKKAMSGQDFLRGKPFWNQGVIG